MFFVRLERKNWDDSRSGRKKIVLRELKEKEKKWTRREQASPFEMSKDKSANKLQSMEDEQLSKGDSKKQNL